LVGQDQAVLTPQQHANRTALEKESQRLGLWEEDLKRLQSLLQLERKEMDQGNDVDTDAPSSL
jgi:hypothetical protein